MNDDCDVIVLGAGPAGETAAGRCADGGLQVVLVERELVGGECSYWACIPSKTLIRPGDVLAAARRVPGAAEAVTGSVDVAAAFAQRDEMVSNWSDEGQLGWLESRHIELVRGHAKVVGERRVDVTPGRAGNQSVRSLSARRAVVVAARPPVACRACVPHGQRGVAAPARGVRPLGRRRPEMPDVSFVP